MVSGQGAAQCLAENKIEQVAAIEYVSGANFALVKIHVTTGPELIVGYIDDRYLRVWFSKELRKCCCNRFAMAMWFVWDGIVKRRGAG